MATTAYIEPIADPRPHVADPEANEIYQRNWGLTARCDPSVSFEEYVYWAKIERAEENEANRIYIEERGPLTISKVLKGRFSKGIHHENKKKAERAEKLALEHAAADGSGADEKGGVIAAAEPSATALAHGAVSDEEWKVAARALKTASWGTVFFLITTDILGWSTTP
jgi:hypothetical protein